MKIKKHAFLLLPLAVLVPPIVIVSCSTNSNSNQDQDQIEQGLYDPAGGKTNGLEVNQYLNVVKKLALNSQTKLTDLNDQDLTQQIQKYDSSASIAIISGSTSKQTLELKLTKANNEELLIKINGFQNQANVVFTYSNFTIDEQKWVENLLSVQTSSDLATLETVSSDVWKAVVENFQIQIDRADDLTNVETTTYKKLLDEGVQFNFKAKNSNATSNLIMKIDAIIPAMIYQNGSWVADQTSQDQIEQLQPDTTILNIPTIDIAKKYVIAKTTIDKSVLATFYPSALEAAIEFNKKANKHFIWNDLVKNDLIADAGKNKIMQKYFKSNTLKLVFDFNDFIANDWTNLLNFNVVLMVDNKIENNIKKEFKNSDKNKSISELEKKSLWEINPTIMNLKDNSQIVTNILKELKQDSGASSKIDAFFTGTNFDEGETPISYENVIDDTDKKSIYKLDSNQNQSEHENTINKVKENLELKFLNKSLKFNYANSLTNPNNDELMFFNGLFNFEGNIFKIKKIDLIIDSTNFGKESILINIKPIKNQSKIKLTFSGKFIIQFDDKNLKTYPISFEYEFDQNKWNSITTP